MKPLAISAISLLLVASPALRAASAPLSPAQAKILESARASALQYTQKLPDFLCTQITHRQVNSLGNSAGSLAGISPSGAAGPRSVLAGLPGTMSPGSSSSDVIEERLTFIDHKENYSVLTLNGRKASGMDHMQFQGAISEGEFGTDLNDIFDPRSETIFAWNREGALHGNRVYIYSFRVPAAHGATVIDRDSGRQAVVSYAGRVFVDAATLGVLRVEYEMDLPPGFPIHEAGIRMEYKLTPIAGRPYLLPFRSEVHLQDQARQYVNTIEFRNYHKFAVESRVLYGGQGP